MERRRNLCKERRAQASFLFRHILNESEPNTFRSKILETEYTTLWNFFERTVRKSPNNKFLGRRSPGREDEDGFEWVTFSQVHEATQYFLLG
jgi:hypothetical protein